MLYTYRMEEGSTPAKEESKKRSYKWLFKLIPYVLVLGAGIYIGTFIVRQRPTWFGLPQGTAQAQAEVDALVGRVSRLMALPTDETPTVATVTDAEKVKDQPFFANAENGDKVLIYQKAGKAILYRESENKIIEVGAVNFNQPVASPTVEPTPTAKPTATPTPETTTP
jgi:cytoskeletal protein RodZ